MKHASDFPTLFSIINQVMGKEKKRVRNFFFNLFETQSNKENNLWSSSVIGFVSIWDIILGRATRPAKCIVHFGLVIQELV